MQANLQAQKTLLYSCVIGVLFGIGVTVFCQSGSQNLIAAFTRDAGVIRYGTQYLRSYSADTIFAAVSFSFSGFFTAYGWSIISFLHNLLSILLIRVPGTWLMSVLFPDSLFCMGLASPAGSLFSACICIGVYLYLLKKHRLFSHEGIQSDTGVSLVENL
mgnify:FL=1